MGSGAIAGAAKPGFDSDVQGDVDVEGQASAAPARTLEFSLGLRAPDSEANVRAFVWIVLLHAACERGASALFFTAAPGVSAADGLLSLAVAAGCCAALVLASMPRWERLAVPVSFFAYLSFEVAAFPENANHGMIVLYLLGFAMLFDLRNEAERRLFVGAGCWLVVIVLFATGFQKAMHGTYFEGQYLAWKVASSDTFAAIFQFLLPADEFERLRGYGTHPDLRGLALFAGERAGDYRSGVGPYRFESLRGLALSNAIWICEMLAPLAMLVPRLRSVAAGIAIGLIAAIELGAREYFFGLLLLAPLLFFLPGELHRRAKLAFALGYALPVGLRIATVSAMVAS